MRAFLFDRHKTQIKKIYYTFKIAATPAKPQLVNFSLSS